MNIKKIDQLKIGDWILFGTTSCQKLVKVDGLFKQVDIIAKTKKGEVNNPKNLKLCDSYFNAVAVKGTRIHTWFHLKERSVEKVLDAKEAKGFKTNIAVKRYLILKGKIDE